MPNYAFKCSDCRADYEKMLTFDEFEQGAPDCPECGGEGNKVIFPAAVHMRYSLMHPRHMRGQKRCGEPAGKKGSGNEIKGK